MSAVNTIALADPNSFELDLSPICSEKYTLRVQIKLKKLFPFRLIYALRYFALSYMH